MIIEDLKDLWDDTASPAAQPQWNEAEIRAMVKKQSRNALSKINRNILLEMGLVAFLCLMLVWGLFQTENLRTVDVIRIAAYVLFSAAFYGVKFYLLNRAKFGSHNLKESLQKTTKVMGAYMTIYKFLTYLAPLLMGGAYMYGVWLGSDGGKNISDLSVGKWALVIGVLLLVSIPAYALFRWYIKLVYGNHYESLKASFGELEMD